MNNRTFLLICFWPGIVFLAYAYLCVDARLWPACWKPTFLFYLMISPLIVFACKDIKK